MHRLVKTGPLLGLSLIACMLIAMAAPDAGAADAGSSIRDRKAYMHENSGMMKTVTRRFLKGGKRALDKDDVVLIGEMLAAKAARIPEFFPKGTSLADVPGKTRAKPAIWQDWGAFQKAAADMRAEAEMFAKVAAGGDKAAIKKQLAVMGKKGCGGCHKMFRGPKPKKKK